jgi:hypothetical protein
VVRERSSSSAIARTRAAPRRAARRSASTSLQYAVAWPSVVSPASVSIVWIVRCRAADAGALDAAVLVAERDLEVEHVLAVALEAEVAGR